MMKYLTLILLCIVELRLTAQFNNVYLNDGVSMGAAIGVEENIATGEYYVPSGYTLDGSNYKLGYLKIDQNGNFNELKHQFNFSQGEYFIVWNRGFFKTQDGGYVLAGNHIGTGADIIRLDENLDAIWEVDDIQDPDLQGWGGGELGNGDIILGYTGGNIPWNELDMSRYSSEGELLDSFTIELDYDFSRPTSFIIDDSLLYVSFSRLLIGSHRRNYIVCYNAITGEELWETHQIENGEALAFTDGYMCMTTDGQLKLVYVESTFVNFPGFFDSSWQGYFEVVNIDPLTGEMSNESVISGSESSSSVIDVVPTNDGGLAVLFLGDNLVDPQYSFYGIMKINAEMEVEWRNLYYQPINLEVYENASYLTELETTSDDCIVAVGDAMGTYFETQISIQHPWVIKLDACGNEIVTDCSLSGLSELSGRNKISIYPNPARDRVFLKAENAIQQAMIFDMNGKMVHDEIFSGAQEQTLFIDHLPQGLYLITAIDNKGVRSSTKVVVEQ
jgi:hypothetical protein